MAIVPLSGKFFPYPQESAANEVAFKYINAHGGINGRKVKLEICDDQNDPNQAAACARKAVQNQDVAVTGSFTLFGDNVMPILKSAGIAYMSTVPLSNLELTSDNSFAFNLGGLLHLEAGMAAGETAKTQPDKDVALVLTPNTQAELTQKMFAIGLKASGFTGKQKLVPVQANATDYSPAVEKATDNTSAMYLQLSPQQAEVYFPALKQAGGDQAIVGTGGNSLAPQIISKNKEVTEGAKVADYYPPIGDKRWKTYRDAVQQYGTAKQKKLDMSLLGATGAWIDALVLKQVVAKIDGAVTAKSVLAQFKSSKSVSTDGLTPPIDLSKPFPDKSLSAIYNAQGAIETVKDGKLTWDGKFVDTKGPYEQFASSTK